MKRVLVVCPTRDRPLKFKRMVDSVAQTSTEVAISAYIDDDQADLYGDLAQNHIVGPRIGLVPAINECVRQNPGYEAYGLITDDSIVTTPGWDQYLLDSIAACPARIGVVNPCHSLGQHVDQPFVSKEWIDQTGWLAWPGAKHYVWTIIIGLIGEMTAIIHAPKDKFFLEHDNREITEADFARMAIDEHAFFQMVALQLNSIVWRMREKMYEQPGNA